MLDGGQVLLVDQDRYRAMRSQLVRQRPCVVVAIVRQQDLVPAAGQREHQGHRRGLAGAEQDRAGLLDRAQRLLGGVQLALPPRP